RPSPRVRTASRVASSRSERRTSLPATGILPQPATFASGAAPACPFREGSPPAMAPLRRARRPAEEDHAGGEAVQEVLASDRSDLAGGEESRHGEVRDG